MPKKILIADDEDTAREFIVYLLKDHDFETFEADDGDKLFKKTEQIHPDLIITDILMPGISGYKAIEKIRLKKEFKNLPVIFCSGIMKDKETFKTLKPPGPCRFLTKPFDNTQLLTTINELLGGDVVDTIDSF